MRQKLFDHLGVVTHLTSEWDTSYSDCANATVPPPAGSRPACPPSVARIAEALNDLGLHRIRDGLSEPYILARFRSLRDRVPGLSILAGLADRPEPERQLALIRQAADAVDGIEGPNEANNRPFRYRDQGFPEGLRREMTELRRLVAADPMLAAIPLIAPSLGGDALVAVARLGNLPMADRANAHAYYGRGAPHGFAAALPAARAGAVGKPVVLTETGNCTTTVGAPWCGVSETVQAKYELMALADAHAAGMDLYFYELVDEAPDPGGRDPEKHFGLFRADWSPKPIALALHRLKVWLDAPGKPTGAIRVTDARSVAVAPGLALVWREADLWDVARNAPRDIAPTTVAVHAPSGARVMRVSDPLTGKRATIPVSKRRSTLLPLPDHPVLVDFDPVNP